MMTFIPVPGHGAGNFAEGKNLANYVDSQFLPLFKWNGDHDPEGLLSTLPAIATCLLGVFAGSLLSHSAVVAREVGIPSVVAVSGVMVALATVDRIRLDAITGTIEVLEKAP